MNRQMLISCNLLIFFSALYLLTFSSLVSIDARVRYAVTQNLVEKADLATEESLGIPGKDGRYYSWFGLGQSLLAVPFYLFGKYVGNPVAAVVMINPFVSALTCVIIFRFCSVLGYSQRASLAAALLYGLGTFAWPYAKMEQEAPVTTFLGLLCFYWSFLYVKRGLPKYLIFSSVSLGMAVLTRLTSFMVVFPIILYLFLSRIGESVDRTTALKFFFKDCLIFFLVMTPFAAIILWYNDYRFGSIYETGYQLYARLAGFQSFSLTYLVDGLLGFLLSPNKSFFLYSPVALLFFFAISGFYRRHTHMATGFLSAMLCYLLFYSSYRFWHGDWAWGPRYLLDITPLLLIPVAHLIDGPKWKTSYFMRWVVYGVVGTSLAVQLIGVSVHPNRYFFDLHFNQGIRFQYFSVNRSAPDAPVVDVPPKEVYFDFRYAPIAEHFKASLGFLKNLSGICDPFGVEDSSKIPSWLNTPNFGWVYACRADEKGVKRTLAWSVGLLVFTILISGYRIYCAGFAMRMPTPRRESTVGTSRKRYSK
jgi:Dolichyl-phosphate-mannose-protein mannosyltransferase